ncbi:hypothetical protein BC7_00044 [Bacillus phage BC-7]|nr:hypothetical protein BC7_00044 [Bacillus phage BC-7]
MRKLRYRAVLKERIGNTGKVYHIQIRNQRYFWKEDKHPNPTIRQVRLIHQSLMSWDAKVKWNSVGWKYIKGVLTPKKGIHNRIELHYRDIYPKANYKPIWKAIEIARQKAKEARWKEQEQRTLEFLEREGC